MIDPSCLQIPLVSTWEDRMHFSKGLTFTNKDTVKRRIIEILQSEGRPKLNCALHALTPITSGMLGHS